MLQQIFMYIVKRESYNQYRGFMNSTAEQQLSFLNSTFKLLLYLLWAALCLFWMYSFGFIAGLSMFFVPVSLCKSISAIISLRRKTLPVYTEIPKYKSDRRYKGGQRFSHYDRVVTGFRALTTDEKRLRTSIFRTKLYLWSGLFAISISYVVYASYTGTIK
jgi:hypothetical protein